LIFLIDFFILSGHIFIPMAGQDGAGERAVATNRKARHEYFILETLEAGLVLKGTEVKSLRQANVNLTDGYVRIDKGEAWLLGVHVSPYKQGSTTNVDPLRSRKLLMHRKEIRRLLARLSERGLTLIPLKVYFKQDIAKVELGLCRGKRDFDKRDAIARREAERDIRRRMRR